MHTHYRHETAWILSALLGERRGLEPLSEAVDRAGHPRCPLIQALLLVLYIPATRLVLRVCCILSSSSCASGSPAIFLRRLLVILRGASSTHPARGEDEWKGEGRGNSREHDVGSEEKRMEG